MQRRMNINHVQAVNAASAAYLDEAANGYAVSVAWKTRAAEACGRSRRWINKRLAEVGDWWGESLWDVYSEGRGTLWTLSGHGLIVVPDFVRIWEEVELCKQAAAVYLDADWSDTVAFELPGIVMLRDFVITEQLLSGYTARQCAAAGGIGAREVIERARVVGGFLGARPVVTLPGSGEPEVTDFGKQVAESIHAIAERYMRMLYTLSLLERMRADT
ncbi:MAG: hypothetical protein ACE5FA_06125 [Dehalococcoidia bacterium]